MVQHNSLLHIKKPLNSIITGYRNFVMKVKMYGLWRHKLLANKYQESPKRRISWLDKSAEFYALKGLSSEN
jgi:hypothetical protein